MNPIEEMRNRLVEEFSRPLKPSKGFQITPMRKTSRATADNMPRFPQSNIPSAKTKYTRAGRPSQTETTKLKKNWENWL